MFNPTTLDARQWAQTAKAGGLKALILTCKHHDGFCLWPSQYTEHSVKNSPWKDGQGDVVRECANACREFGLKFGVYLSPWDRNHADYGQPAYIDYYRNQLRELLTNYGPIFEVWYDGANGGDGYYGGARETRKIDAAVYYDWPNTWKIVRELQPEAVLFSDAGPDIRWVGNENGIGPQPNWCTFNTQEHFPGKSNFSGQASGHQNGTDWVPAETDVSIRPGWFYHSSQDESVKTPLQLVEIYFQSVGRGTSLLLNLPPDQRGLIHEIDTNHLKTFHTILTEAFANNLAKTGAVAASSTHIPDAKAAHLIDENPETYWAAQENCSRAEITLDFKAPVTFNILQMKETIQLGQRVHHWALESGSAAGEWQHITSGTTIGAQRLARFSPVTTQRVRLQVEGLASPVLTSIGLFDHEIGILESPKKEMEK